jgi:hypothetical protein
MPMNLANRLGHITGMLLVSHPSRTGRRRQGLWRAQLAPTGPKNQAQGRREAKALGSHDCKSLHPNGAREHTPPLPAQQTPRTPSPPPPRRPAALGKPPKKPGNSR